MRKWFINRFTESSVFGVILRGVALILLILLLCVAEVVETIERVSSKSKRKGGLMRDEIA